MVPVDLTPARPGSPDEDGILLPDRLLEAGEFGRAASAAIPGRAI